MDFTKLLRFESSNLKFALSTSSQTEFPYKRLVTANVYQQRRRSNIDRKRGNQNIENR